MNKFFILFYFYLIYKIFLNHKHSFFIISHNNNYYLIYNNISFLESSKMPFKESLNIIV
jgi:hypothetical protein